MVTIEGYETIIYTEDDLATSFKGNKMNEWTNEPEAPKIKKSKSTLTNPHYDTPQTSPLIFHFEPDHFPSSEDRLRKIQIQHASIEGKSVYVFDDFFSQEEAQEIRAFSKNASFSRNSYGSPEAIKQGEAPARSMNGKERWQFFSNPPRALHAFYKLLSTFGREMDAEISTLPWELCDTASNGSPSVIGNFLERASSESMDLGRHKDCNPEEGIAFGIPILYSSEKSFYENRFENGSRGHPWIISIMLYSTAENYSPEYCMGTTFYKDHAIVLRTECQNCRLVLFDTDLVHSIEESKIPEAIQTWRVSYVFKLVLNPRRVGASLRAQFFEWMKGFSPDLSAAPLGSARRL